MGCHSFTKTPMSTTRGLQNGVNIVGITADDRVWLTAGGDITGASVTSTGTGTTNPDQNVRIESTSGGVDLASVSGRYGVSVAGAGGVDDVVPDEVLSDAHSGVVGVSSGRESTDAGLIWVGSVVLAQEVAVGLLGSAGGAGRGLPPSLCLFLGAVVVSE